MRIFVSFSGRDRRVGGLARSLWLSLERNSFEVFNYERPEQAIPFGESIEKACKEEIERADRCVVVISKSAFESDWTRMEVKYAISLRRENFIIPLALVDPENWLSPYDQLSGVHGALVVDASFSFDQASDIVESTVRNLCVNNNLQYIPPEDAIPRVPLKSKVRAEIFSKECLDSSHAAKVISDFDEWCDDFVDAYKNEDLEGARAELDIIIRKMKRKFIGIEPYYPVVMQIVIDLQIGQRRGIDRRQLELLVERIETLVCACGDALDANIFALLGNIKILLGEPLDALGQFERAERELTSADPALFYNRLLSSVLAGGRDRVEKVAGDLRPLMDGAVVAEPGGLRRIRIVYAIALCYLGRVGEAIAVFEDEEVVMSDGFDIIGHFLDEAQEQAKRVDDLDASRRVLALMRSIEPMALGYSLSHWVAIAQRIAFMAIELDDPVVAERTIRELLSHNECERSVQIEVDAALVFHACRKDREALDCSLRALDLYERSPSASPDDGMVDHTSQADFYYYAGLAAWLLGKDELSDSLWRMASNIGDCPRYEEGFSWVSRERLVPVIH